MKRFAILIGVALLVLSCQKVAEFEDKLNESGIPQAVQEGANLVQKHTGYPVGGIVGLITTLMAGGFAVNRQLLANRRGKAIEEADAHPDTPPVKDQVTSEAAKKAVAEVVAKKTVKDAKG